ncbi:hypothetical protein [Arhodomonas sp. SL1]|uniref:hypothetical protein n=1 Tax=Arhodomonas sp. SL1 TaxID=3425691 RepID=UPI003F88332A
MANDNPQDAAPEAGAGQVLSEGNARKGGGTLGRIWHFSSMFPWTLLLIAIALVLEVFTENIRGTTIDYTMVVVAAVVLVIEVAKSADIKMVRFIVDLVAAIVALIVATALLTYYITTTGKVPAFYHWVVAGVLVIDAILSPAISFATALRNMALGD